MKEFIKRISKGSKLVLFLEILLLVQVVMIIYIYATRPECNHNSYPGRIGIEDGAYE